MPHRIGLVSALALTVIAGPALAETTSEVLFRHKHWVVKGVTFDDGTIACLAEVDDPNDSFSIWTYPDWTVKLQFYSTAWDFGDNGDTADLEVEIDNRSPWSLTGADLYMQSVLFTLPDDDAAVNFLREVQNGSRMYLRSAEGEDVVNYSLAGSSASIAALGECTDSIAQDSNPFD